MVTLEEVLASPELPRWQRVIDETLRQERARRARFQEELRPGQKAEFINGAVILHSPVRWLHSLVCERVVVLLSTFVRTRGLGRIGFEKVLVSLTRNDYEPDVVFYRLDRAAAFGPEQKLFPAPDLVVEVLSPSTHARDRGVKLVDYALHGVGEYWIVDADVSQVDQYVLDPPPATAYRLAGSFGPGQELRSVVIADFAAPVQALFDDAVHAAALRRVFEESGSAA